MRHRQTDRSALAGLSGMRGVVYFVETSLALLVLLVLLVLWLVLIAFAILRNGVTNPIRKRQRQPHSTTYPTTATRTILN